MCHSANSVEDIIEIRDEVNFLPTKAKYRVYIIDEVHMLSTGAFNALLKTLEEPPSHVKFILATTEPQKLPTTILSRCQRFDFKKIPENDIIKRLKIICDSSEIKIDEEALKIMAVLSEGHMRDAISILERCSQENTEKITSDEVKELVGLPKLEFINRITRAIIEKDEITIRDFTETDLPLMFKWLTDKRVLEYYEGRDVRFTMDTLSAHFLEAIPDDDDMPF